MQQNNLRDSFNMPFSRFAMLGAVLGTTVVGSTLLGINAFAQPSPPTPAGAPARTESKKLDRIFIERGDGKVNGFKMKIMTLVRDGDGKVTLSESGKPMFSESFEIKNVAPRAFLFKTPDGADIKVFRTSKIGNSSTQLLVLPTADKPGALTKEKREELIKDGWVSQGEKDGHETFVRKSEKGDLEIPDIAGLPSIDARKLKLDGRTFSLEGKDTVTLRAIPALPMIDGQTFSIAGKEGPIILKRALGSTTFDTIGDGAIRWFDSTNKSNKEELEKEGWVSIGEIRGREGYVKGDKFVVNKDGDTLIITSKPGAFDKADGKDGQTFSSARTFILKTKKTEEAPKASETAPQK